MSQINVVVNLKGGVGKTTAANHVLPYLTNSEMIFEIDNSNFSSIFAESLKIEGKSFSTEQKELESAIADADFDSFDKSVIIDSGAGDDSEKVIKAIQALNLDVVYWIPLMPDRKALIPLKKTLDLINQGKKQEINLIFSNFTNLKEDFWFIFGSDDGFEQDLSILDNFDFLYEMPKTNIFGKVEVFNTTAWDYALLHQEYVLEEEKVKWRQEGRDYHHAMLNVHRRSVECFEYLEQVLNSAKKVQK